MDAGHVVADGVVQMGKDLALDPVGIVRDTVFGTCTSIADGLGKAGQMLADGAQKLGTDIAENPGYYEDKVSQLMDAWHKAQDPTFWAEQMAQGVKTAVDTSKPYVDEAIEYMKDTGQPLGSSEVRHRLQRDRELV